jgi:hypothetical protein
MDIRKRNWLKTNIFWKCSRDRKERIICYDSTFHNSNLWIVEILMIAYCFVHNLSRKDPRKETQISAKTISKYYNLFR